MNDLLLNTVKRQKRELTELSSLATVVRGKTAHLQSILPSPLIKVIIGPRRAGKSTIALQALKNQKFAYINFEDETLPNITDGDEILDALSQVYGDVDYYFFDEIQNFDRWQQFLNRLQRTNKNAIVTGSNARLLSEELASSLTGRHTAIEILPFSFKEVESVSNQESAFEQYLISGGFPEVVTKKADFATYLTALWDAIILKDIARRKKVRNISALSDVLSLLLSGTSSRFNVDSLRRSLSDSVSSPTIKKFIAYGEEAYLISELILYSHKPRVRIKSDRKIYTVDNGLFNAKNINFSDNHGLLLENAVFNELRNRGFRPNESLFYYVTRSGFEVDFITRKGHKNKEAIQVCHSLKRLKTRERELRALREAAEELEISRLRIITMNEESSECIADKNIEVVAAKRWLLET